VVAENDVDPRPPARGGFALVQRRERTVRTEHTGPRIRAAPREACAGTGARDPARQSDGVDPVALDERAVRAALVPAEERGA
jgi:hypothetical protein